MSVFSKIKSFLFKNKSDKQTVAKNTVWLSISNFGGRMIKAVVIIYAARVIGAAGYGVFSYTITLAGFLTLFMDPGINAALMRDSAKANDKDRLEIFSTMFFIKIILLVIGVSVILFAGPYFTTLPGAKVLLPVAAIILLFDTLREFSSSFVRSIEKMELEAATFIFTNFAIMVFCFIVLIIHPSPQTLGWGYALGSMVGAIFAFIVLRRYMRGITKHFNPKIIMPILESAWPFAVTGALGLLLTSADILIISWLRPATEVGIYSAVIRIIQAVYLVPAIIQLSTLPLFARLANRDDIKLRHALERIIGMIFLISLPIAVGGAIVGTQLMTLVFGAAYTSGGLALKILAITMIVDFPATILSNAIFAYGHQKSLIVASAIGGILNVAFDFLLIPHFGMAGSAFGTLLAQAASNTYLWHKMKKLNNFHILGEMKKIIGATVLMGVVVGAFWLEHISILISIPAGILVYFAALYWSREPLLRETTEIFSGKLHDLASPIP